CTQHFGPALFPSGISGLQTGQAGWKELPHRGGRPGQYSKRPQAIAMPTIKTHRGAAKRFRKTASGKFKAGHANRSHILTKKATKRKRNLRQTNHVRAEDAGRLNRMLPYL